MAGGHAGRLANGEGSHSHRPGHCACMQPPQLEARRPQTLPPTTQSRFQQLTVRWACSCAHACVCAAQGATPGCCGVLCCAVQVKRTLRRMASLFQLMRPLRRATQLELIMHTWQHVRVVLLTTVSMGLLLLLSIDYNATSLLKHLLHHTFQRFRDVCCVCQPDCSTATAAVSRCCPCSPLLLLCWS